MTSIELFHETEQQPTRRPNWGTGRLGAIDLWVPKAPTWHATGFPLEHPYQITSLALSNVRDNDELIPRPANVDVTKRVINKPFPAEHPYASHTEKFALFPTFDSPQDKKRGAAARQQKPISNEMPANPYNTQVVKKTFGFPYRQEILFLPTEGNKEALYWQGEHFFDQQSKMHGGRPQYYPTPIKTINPNLQHRPPELQISERSQNTLRNIERNQWMTTQKLDYTGLGPANPMMLDNLDCKTHMFFQTGEWSDDLYPHSVNTFDPARPLEGRLRKLFAPKPAQQINIESGFSANPDHKRKKTSREISEDLLLYGKDYVNLPQDYNENFVEQRCHNNQIPICLDSQNTPRPRSSQEAQKQQKHEYIETDYLQDQKNNMSKKVQQMEAQNRWQLLENGTPAHDLMQLKEKYKMLKNKELPSTFYHHEGKYNEERAGLYKTSYNPDQLTYSMNAQRLSGGTLFNTSLSHVEASQYPTVIWDENEAALKDSHTVVFKNNELSGDRPATSDVLNPYRETVALQRAALQPDVATASPRVQEGGFIVTESTYGERHSTKKFLQENKLQNNIRIDPRDIMSHENQNLERIREKAAPRNTLRKQGSLKAVRFSDNVNVTNMQENCPVKLEESHIRPLNKAEQEELSRAFGYNTVTSLSYRETQDKRPQTSQGLVGDPRNLAENLLGDPAVPTVVGRNTNLVLGPPFVSFTRDPQMKVTPISEMADQFRSLSTNFMPTGVQNASPIKSSYSAQFPHFNLAEKKDKRFDWEPGKGQMKPQSCLQEMQDSFIKSEIRKKFHHQFPEVNPDLRIHLSRKRRTLFSTPSVNFNLPKPTELC
ncbi:unnamed protein product [Lymnaea stagnalis]|uniref:Uncharacterized protein n=1 Tax=Lymnaea stagnalis TaxID=6523 RepID=A0AAV2I579_LYMST